MFSNRLPEMKDRRTSPVSQVIGRKPSALVGFGALVILILTTCLSFAIPTSSGSSHNQRARAKSESLAAYRFNLSSDGLEWGWSLLCKLWGGPPAFTHDLLAYTSWVTLTLESLTLTCTRKSSSERRSDSSSLWIGWLGSAISPGLNRREGYSFGPISAQQYQALLAASHR